MLQINLPDSVTKRCLHSLSTFILEPHCIWIIVTGGHVKLNQVNVIDPNITMLIELGKKVNKHSIDIILTTCKYSYVTCGICTAI